MAAVKSRVRIILRLDPSTAIGQTVKTLVVSSDALFLTSARLQQPARWRSLVLSILAHVVLFPAAHLAWLRLQPFPLDVDFHRPPLSSLRERTRLVWIPVGKPTPVSSQGAPEPSDPDAAQGSGATRRANLPSTALRPPRFRVPRQLTKPEVKQTALQPDLPPDLPADLAVRLPNLAIEPPERPNVPRPDPERFLSLRRAEVAPVPAKTQLAADLEQPAVEVNPTTKLLPNDVLAHLPAVSLRPTERYRLRKAPASEVPPKNAAAELETDSAPLLAFSDRPEALTSVLAVPEINQASPTHSADGPAGFGSATSDGGEGASSPRSALGPGAVGVNTADAPGSDLSQTRRADTRQGAGGGAELATISVFGGEQGPSGEGGLVRAADPYPIHVVHPENGRFDMVIVQTGGGGGPPGSDGVIKARPVYTVYLSVGEPKEWILYYAVAGENPVQQMGQIVTLENAAPVQAPYPIETVIPSSLRDRRKGFVMIHGVLNQEGRWTGLTVVGGDPPGFKQDALPLLMEWRFRPATRDGVPVAVEILLAIPPTRA